MGREVRRVPADWDHPRDGRGHLIPLHEKSHRDALAEWEDARELFARRRHRTLDGEIEPLDAEGWTSFEEYYGERPDPADYMPDWTDEQRTHLQMYETCSEGTPLSPPMETPEELALWLANNRASAFGNTAASYEEWLGSCRSGYAPTMVFTPGKGIQSGVASCPWLTSSKR